MSDTDLLDTTLVVLCGGGGERMGGVDKPLLELRGKPMALYVVEALAPVTAATVISCNRNEALYAQWGHPVPDAVEDAGPLAGVSSALTRVRTPLALVVPGDAPAVTVEVALRLRRALGSAQAVWPVADGREHFLFLLLRTNLSGNLHRWLEGSGRAVRQWLATIDGHPVPMDDLSGALTNVNAPEELRDLEQSTRDWPPRSQMLTE